MRRRGARAFATAFVIFVTQRFAHAEPAAPAPALADDSARTTAPETGDPAELPPRPPARAMGLVRADAPAQPQAAPRGAYVHDGMFVRAAVGPALFQAWSGSSADARTFNGGTVSIDAAVGGAPARGFNLGAEFHTDRVFSLSSTDRVVNGNEPDLSDTRFSVSSVSIFVDGYPDPTDGLHFLGAVGVGWLDVAHSHSGDTPSPTGAMLTLGAGYEWFVGPDVSLGVLLRGDLGLLSVSETSSGSSTSVTTFVPALLATLTYN